MKSYDGQLIYQIFVRNYSKEGTFEKVSEDIERIKKLGTDIIYLTPINEIGVKCRKGTYGSPYASKDYFSISSDLGTIDDLVKLIEKTHKNDMKIILDMVFNHTSPDNVLVNEHLDYYYLKNGKPGNRVGEWEDIIDLNVEKKETQDYLISVLKYWRKVGFDGFRFDVASLIPLSFFKRARLELGDDVIFFAECVEDSFKKYLWDNGYYCAKDEELVPTFNILYNYNYHPYLKDYLKTKNRDSFRKIIEIINKESKEHADILRANCLENHDNERIASYLSKNELENFLTMFTLIKGTSFIYAGEEYGNKHKPELFEKDPVDWSTVDEDVYYHIISLKDFRKVNGEVKEQYIEEIGDTFSFIITQKYERKIASFLVNLSGSPIKIKDIIPHIANETVKEKLNKKEGDFILPFLVLLDF